jgi:hypothetical protein
MIDFKLFLRLDEKGRLHLALSRRVRLLFGTLAVVVGATMPTAGRIGIAPLVVFLDLVLGAL